MIVFKDYRTSAFSIEDADTLTPLIDKEIKEYGKSEIDFSGINLHTSLFFNNAISSTS